MGHILAWAAKRLARQLVRPGGGQAARHQAAELLQPPGGGPAAQGQLVHGVADVHGARHEGVGRALGAHVQGARHLLDGHEAVDGAPRVGAPGHEAGLGRRLRVAGGQGQLLGGGAGSRQHALRERNDGVHRAVAHIRRVLLHPLAPRPAQGRRVVHQVGAGAVDPDGGEALDLGVPAHVHRPGAVHLGEQQPTVAARRVLPVQRLGRRLPDRPQPLAPRAPGGVVVDQQQRVLPLTCRQAVLVHLHRPRHLPATATPVGGRARVLGSRQEGGRVVGLVLDLGAVVHIPAAQDGPSRVDGALPHRLRQIELGLGSQKEQAAARLSCGPHTGAHTANNHTHHAQHVAHVHARVLALQVGEREVEVDAQQVACEQCLPRLSVT